MASNATILNLNSVNPRTNVPIVRNGYTLFGRFNSISTFPVYMEDGSISRVMGTVCLVDNSFNKVGLRSVTTPEYFRVRGGLGRGYSVPVFRSSRRNATIVITTNLVGSLGLIRGGLSRVGIIVGNTNTTNVTVTGRLLGVNMGSVALYSDGNVVYGNSPELGTIGRRVTRVAGLSRLRNSLTSTVGNTSMFLKVSTTNYMDRRVIGSVTGSPVLFTVTGPAPRVVPSVTGGTNTTIMNANEDSFAGRVGGMLTFPNVFENTLSYHTDSVGRRVGITTSFTVTSLIDSRRLGTSCVLPRTFSGEVNGAITRTIGGTTVRSNITEV